MVRALCSAHESHVGIVDEGENLVYQTEKKGRRHDQGLQSAIKPALNSPGTTRCNDKLTDRPLAGFGT